MLLEGTFSVIRRKMSLVLVFLGDPRFVFLSSAAILWDNATGRARGHVDV